MTPPANTPFWSSRRLTWLGVLLLLLSLGRSGLQIWNLREAALRDARQDTVNLGTAITEQTARSLQAVDLVLGQIRDMPSVASGEALEGGEAAHDMLLAHMRNLPQAEALSLVDARGRVVAQSRSWPSPEIDVSDRAYFRHLRDQDDTTLFLSEPVQNRSSGMWTMYAARRLNDSEHRFAGVALCAVPLSYFEAFYAAATGQSRLRVTLLRDDGIVIAEHPSGAQPVGRRLAEDEWARLVAQGGGAGRLSDGVGGGMQMVSVHPLQSYPLVVDVGASEWTTLEGWREQAVYVALWTVLALATLLVLLRALTRQLRWLEIQRAELSQTAAALRESEQGLSQKSALLETTLAHMDQGLMMVSADHVVEVCNARAIELLDLPPALMAAQPRFEQVLEHQWNMQEFSRADMSLLEFVRSGGILDVPQTYERQRPNGRVLEIRSTPLAGGGVVRTYTDITDRRASEERVRHSARHDELTGLANRAVFREQLAQSVDLASRTGHGLAVLYLDLDRFKLVNDTRGHAAGDKLLREVARRMRGAVRGSDTVARMGGDEFAILQTIVNQPDSAQALAQRLLEVVAEPYDIDGERAVIGVSIGISLFPADAADPDELVRQADAALYLAKESGRSALRFYDPTVIDPRQERLELEQELRGAIAARQFDFAYQPIFEADARSLIGFEALLRWDHPTRGLLEPRQFVPLAEASGLIVSLGYQSLEQACKEAAGWAKPLRIAVNLSPAQFQQPGLAEAIIDILARTGLAPERLELEVTESVLLDDAKDALAVMHRLREARIGLTLDNFGARQANLSHLRRFPFDKVKIARSVVQSLLTDEEARTIVEATLALSRQRRMEVAAEGIETEDQLAAMRLRRCSQVQGFLLGRPMTVAQAREQISRPGGRVLKLVGQE